MTERQILVSGIRTIGLAFFLLGVTDTFSFVSLLIIYSSVGHTFVLYALLRIFVALGMMRFAPAIASRIADPFSDRGVPPSYPANWERWLFCMTAVFVIATSWPQSIFIAFRNAAVVSSQGDNLSLALFGVIQMIVIELGIIVALLSMLRFRPRWILGRSAYSDR